MTRTRPKLLDLYCGSGGAARGYFDAGFDVIGVDISARKHYPYTLIQTDAIDFVLTHGHEFDAVHASPPCQRYSEITPERTRFEHPDLIATTREALETVGLPYVIENVPGARRHLRNPALLCGDMFNLKTYRHRYFETNWMFIAPTHRKHIHKCPPSGRGIGSGGFISITGSGGNGGAGIEYERYAMGVDWPVPKSELSEMIPPAYTRWIGGQLLQVVSSLQAGG